MLRASASATSRQAAMCAITSRSSSTKAVPATARERRRSHCSRIAAPVVVTAAASSSSSSSSSSPDSSSSSFESSLNETQANDALIDPLLACKGPKEVIEFRFRRGVELRVSKDGGLIDKREKKLDPQPTSTTTNKTKHNNSSPSSSPRTSFRSTRSSGSALQPGPTPPTR